jgi:hypothetical protein
VKTHHTMVVEHGADEHDIPENLQNGDGEEQKLDQRRVLMVEHSEHRNFRFVEVSKRIG